MHDTAVLPRSQRHYGLDWLRIGAFALLIVYHIGMVFSPWQWVIKTNHALPWLIPPMALLIPWRLALLFAVSGYAGAKLWERQTSLATFAHGRNARLLVPLGFAMAVLVPVEMWVRVMENGYPHGYLHFWTLDYWRVGTFWGRSFPSWEHLWFVAYLWAYTMVLCALLRFAGPRGAALRDMLIAWLAGGNRLLWAPAVVLATAKLALMFVIPERQGLTTDWAGHAWYLPLFLFGFTLGRTPALWPVLARNALPAAVTSAVAGLAVVAVEMRYPGTTVPPHEWMVLDRTARIAMGWSMVLALFDAADRWLNRDHRWRATLSEAVFPFYIVHHAAIVLTAWYTLPLNLGALREFIVLLSATLAACIAFYTIGRDIGWLRPLIGLAPMRSTKTRRTAAVA